MPSGDRPHRVRVRTPAGAGCNAEQALLRVEGMQPAVRADLDPGDVVTQGLHPPARQGGLEHGQVRLTARRGKCGRDVVAALLRRSELGKEHVLGQPTLLTGDNRGDPQRVALLAQQRVASVPGAVGPDQALLGEVRDVFRGVARPRPVRLAGCQRRTDTVQPGHELAIISEERHCRRSAAGHDVHRCHDIGRVGQLDPEHRFRRGQRTHAVRNDVHRAAAHAVAEQAGEHAFHLVRIFPVVRHPGVARIAAADEGAVFDPRDIRRVRSAPERIGLPIRVESDERPRIHKLVGDPPPLSGRPVHPHDPVRLGQLSAFPHPGQQPGVCRRGGVQSRNHRNHTRLSAPSRPSTAPAAGPGRGK